MSDLNNAFTPVWRMFTTDNSDAAEERGKRKEGRGIRSEHQEN